MNARWIAVGALSVVAGAVAGVAQRTPPPGTVKRGQEVLSESDEVRHGRHYVLAIGIDHYQNWPVLNTAVSDATGFAKLLTGQFGFEYAAEPLTEKDATRENINSLIDDELRGKLRPEDDLVVFFAGHGTTRNDKVGGETRSVGFLVPFEARAPGEGEHWSDYLKIEELLRTISTLPSGRILVILDSCHSGMALGNKFVTSRADTRFQGDMLRNVSRKVITSAQGDQLAADGGPLSGHSLFTGIMMQGLTTGKADSFHEGFITSSQLGAYTQHEVGVEEGSKQTPLFGAFDLDAGGELIIPLGAGTAPAATGGQAAALTLREKDEVGRIRADDRRYWQQDDPARNFPAARSATVKLCDGGDGWACGQAAQSFRQGLGGSADYTRAAELARKGCEAKVSESCVVLGILFQDGQTIRPNLEGARKLYEQACAEGNLHGCADLGNTYNTPESDDLSVYKATQLYDKACKGAEMVGCENLGRIYEKGGGFLDKNYGEAVSLYRKACDGGALMGCNNLGGMYEQGWGVEKDYVRALSYFRQACDSGELRGCVSLGQMYAAGKGVGKDQDQARSLFGKSCDEGEMRGCWLLGSMIRGQQLPTPTKAMLLFEKACDGGEMEACRELGYIYLIERVDSVKGASFYRRGCDGGDMSSCERLGEAFEEGALSRPSDAGYQARSLFQTACSGGDTKACWELGNVILKGDSLLPADPARAVGLFELACKGDDVVGCVYAGDMFEGGTGVEKDAGQATTRYRKACDGGQLQGCWKLALNYARGLGVAQDLKEAEALSAKACKGGISDACVASNSPK